MRCDIFCKVVDNYGDIGVCWRLARQLVAEHSLTVRLWVDDLESFRRLAPALDAQRSRQELAGVSVWRWDDRGDPMGVAEIVVEAFACDPPPPYIKAMAECRRKPVWINLEYLSAESWVEGSHALPSPHPRLPLVKHFFFPGFSEKTGGLIREAGLIEKDRAFQLNSQAQQAFWRRLCVEAPSERALKLSVFAYENSAIFDLLDACSIGEREVFCAVTDSRIVPQVQEWAKRNANYGRLHLVFLPFLSQDDYDLLLAACDLNFVRGEDSFVRAQWAAKPFVWHIYQQEEGAHLIKLEAFLAAYTNGLCEDGEVLRHFWQDWEAEKMAPESWLALLDALPALESHAVKWRQKLVAQGDLASKLLIFCGDLLQSGPL